VGRITFFPSAHVYYADARVLRDRRAKAALTLQLEHVLRALTESWREWRACVTWMQTGILIRLHPTEEREHFPLPHAGASNRELIDALAQSAKTQQARVTTLFAGLEDEYATLCEQQQMPVDLSLGKRYQ
jgi:hypothetical protein